MEAKIRVLVSHEDTRFVVLISASKTVRELKNELLETYKVISGQPVTEEISDNLQLLAYDGFILCDQFVLFDALYDGCMVTTIMRTNSDSSRSHKCCKCHGQPFPCTSIQPSRSSFYTQLPPTLHSYQNPWISPFNVPYYLSNHPPSAMSVDNREVATQPVSSHNMQSPAIETPSTTATPIDPSLQLSQPDKNTSVSDNNENATQNIAVNQASDVNVIESNSPIQKKRKRPDGKNGKDEKVKNSFNVFEFDDGASEMPINVVSNLLKKAIHPSEKRNVKMSEIFKKSKTHQTEDNKSQKPLISRTRKRKLSGSSVSSKRSLPILQSTGNTSVKYSNKNSKTLLPIRKLTSVEEDCSSLSSSWSSIDEGNDISKNEQGKNSEPTIGLKVSTDSSSSKGKTLINKTNPPVESNDVSGSSDSDEESPPSKSTVREKEKSVVEEGNPSSSESNNVSDHLENAGKNVIEEEELSSDSSTSSDEEDNTIHDNFDGKKQSSQTLRALANDADITSRNVQMKSSLMVPASSNIKKKLLQKTSLLKKGAPLSIEKSKTSTPVLSTRSKLSKKASGGVGNKGRVIQQQSLDNMSQEETQMALNLTQDALNVSKVLNDERIW